MARYRILLIDDEQLVREELGGLLEDEGFEVLTASDGEQGLQAFRSVKPDMVITDVRMPRKDGLSVAMTVRKEASHVPVTVITGHGNEAMVIEALRAGVTDFIKKPVRWEDLSLALNRMMESLRVPAVEDQRTLPSSVEIIERTWRYRCANNLEDVPQFVVSLLACCASDVDEQVLAELNVALRELLVNAIEHGNLNISFEEKTKALEAGTFRELVKQRLEQPELNSKRVAVTVRRKGDEVTFDVEDEGHGFSWQDLPDPTDPANLLAEHGRGVLLARLSVDELTYSGRGNRVTLRKLLTKRALS